MKVDHSMLLAVDVLRWLESAGLIALNAPELSCTTVKYKKGVSALDESQFVQFYGSILCGKRYRYQIEAYQYRIATASSDVKEDTDTEETVGGLRFAMLTVDVAEVAAGGTHSLPYKRLATTTTVHAHIGQHLLGHLGTILKEGEAREARSDR